MEPTRLIAHAKLNLGLQVTGRRADGYHELASLMVNIDLADEVELAPGASVVTGGPYADVAGDPAANLAWLAMGAMSDAAGRPLGLGVRVVKRIPAGAGLGGGSADAAAVLRAAAALQVVLPASALAALALSLGADVPYQLHGGTALVTGVGEHIQPLPHLDAYVAVAFRTACSTQAVFAELGADEWSDGAAVREAADTIVHGARGAAGRDAGAVATMVDDLPNDLLAAATRRYPALEVDRSALAEAGWRPRLTGSGGGFYQLAGEASEARDLAASARRAGFAAWACRTVAAPAANNPTP